MKKILKTLQVFCLFVRRQYFEVTIWSQGLTYIELYGYLNDLLESIQVNWPEGVIISVTPKNHVERSARCYESKPGFLIRVSRIDPKALKEICMGLEVEKGIRVSDIDIYTSRGTKISRIDLGHPNMHSAERVLAPPRAKMA